MRQGIKCFRHVNSDKGTINFVSVAMSDCLQNINKDFLRVTLGIKTFLCSEQILFTIVFSLALIARERILSRLERRLIDLQFLIEDPEYYVASMKIVVGSQDRIRDLPNLKQAARSRKGVLTECCQMPGSRENQHNCPRREIKPSKVDYNIQYTLFNILCRRQFVFLCIISYYS
jgi:hypothetical protein